MSVTMKNETVEQLGVAASDIYECPPSTVGRVVNCTITNDTTSVVTVTIYKVPSGDSAGAANLIMNTRRIASLETYLCPEVVGQVLNAGDKIQGLAGTASQATISLDVAEIV